ncbi:MAG: S8 family peptidase [Polyangia bacterium]
MTKTRLSAWIGSLLLGTAALANASPAQPLSDAPALSLDELQLAAAIRSQQALPDLVVDLDDRVDDLTVRVLARRYGVRFVADSSYVGHDRIYRVFIDKTGDQASRLSSLLRALRHDPLVEAADLELLYQIPETAPGALTSDDRAGRIPASSESPKPADRDGKPRFQPSDPKYRYQWHLDQINMPEAWMLSRGQGVTVAVIDTGVTKVEDLHGTELVPGWNFVNDNPDAQDDHGHGTHVAGTIAQTTDNGIGVAGVAPHARIMPIKVLSGSGSGSVAGIAEGIRWAADHGAQVINMSLGGPFNSPVLANAVRYAHDHGVVVVCAAGNDGRGRVSYPAANRGAIAVAATQFDETTTFYSNWGKEITIAAPGGNTRIDQNGDGVPDGVLQNTIVPGDISRQDYLGFMGTSMASPHVAGVAALVVSQGVRDPDAVAKILKQTARRPVHYRGSHDNHYGAGIVDALAAVLEARAQVAMQSQTAQDVPPVGIRLLALGLVAASLAYAGLRRRSFLSSGNGTAL